jgi:hypothetical protein
MYSFPFISEAVPIHFVPETLLIDMSPTMLALLCGAGLTLPEPVTLVIGPKSDAKEGVPVASALLQDRIAFLAASKMLLA